MLIGLSSQNRHVRPLPLFRRVCAKDLGRPQTQKEKKKEAKLVEQDSESDESSLSEAANRLAALAPDHPDALPLVAWDRVCRRLRVLLGRGQGNFHLQNAYVRCGIPGRPKICIPGGTRMIVYSSAFLRQSFAHFKARYEALSEWALVLQRLSEDPSNKSRRKHQKKWQTIVRAGHRLARASNMLPAFFGALVLLVAERLYPRSSTGSEDQHGIFSFAHVGPSRAFELVASRAIAASCGDVAGSSLCLVAGP